MESRFDAVDKDLRELKQMTGAVLQNVGSLAEAVTSSRTPWTSFQLDGSRELVCTLEELARAFALPHPASSEPSAEELVDDTVLANHIWENPDDDWEDANHDWEEDGDWTALERAAYSGYLDVVEALLDAGAGELGWPLLESARRGHTAVVALLLDRGVDVHYWDDAALEDAAREGHLETVTLLLQRGATARDDMLAAAVQRGHHAIADLLRVHGAV